MKKRETANNISIIDQSGNYLVGLDGKDLKDISVSSSPILHTRNEYADN